MKSSEVRNSKVASIFLAVAAAASTARAQATRPSAAAAAASAPDLQTQRTLYVVGYAHLDTQWRWSYPQVIREYIRATLEDNFKNLDKYPACVFNFTGARRYQFMKEYYPEDYATLKRYIADGRWFPCGASVDESDCNLPSGESLVRHVLYGNRYFLKEFGVESQEVMRPDSFGFTAALPSVLAHCGIRGYSTQKLTWGSAVGIPFNVGVWTGPDGHGVIAAFNPGSYGGVVTTDLSHSEGWVSRLDKDKAASGISADYFYYGTGDRGGAPLLNSLKWVERSVKGDGPVKVISGPADQMFKDITDAERAHLPTYSGDLLLTGHSTGALTSEAFMKRANRKNELLADGAERASVAASWLGAASYPAQQLYDAWMLLLGSQMHDMLPGTCLPAAYAYAWNDEFVVANQLSSVERSAVGAIAGTMDTRAEGVPLVIYNPLSTAREDVVEATVTFPSAAPETVTVYGPDGKSVPAQVVSRDGNSARILIVAKAPSVGLATYDVRPGGEAAASELKVSDRTLENARYKVTLNDAGDVASVIDKANGNKELLSAPARLEIRTERPVMWPSWNMDWSDRQGEPRARVDGPAEFKVVENGAARVAIEVTRQAQGSIFRQVIRLSAGGAGDRVEFDTHVNWRTASSSLKQAFPLTVSNPMATYDLQSGAIRRGNNDEKKYEVPQHQWLDVTDSTGNYGVSVLNDSKYGSDKPSDDVVRLTLLYTPGVRRDYQDQGSQDFGKHDILYALQGHTGDVATAPTAWVAQRLNQPLRAFAVDAHAGAAKTFSLVTVDNAQIAITALKKAEDSDAVIVRLRELSGHAAKAVRVSGSAAIASAREVNGQEREIAPATVTDGALVADIGAYELRAFELHFAPTASPAKAATSTAVSLPFDTTVASRRDHPGEGAMDEAGLAYPAELIPADVNCGGVNYKLATTGAGAVKAKGQKIALPGADRVYILAASSDGDVEAPFEVDGVVTKVKVQNWAGFIGQWDTRIWSGEVPELAYSWTNPLVGLSPGYVKPSTIAWHSTMKRNRTGGDEYYQYSYVYAYELAAPKGARELKLPDDPRVKVLAVTAVSGGTAEAKPAAPLFDTLADHVVDAPRISVPSGELNDSTAVEIGEPTYWNGGTLRYTTDGSDVTERSPRVDGPVFVSSAMTLRARQFDADGKGGPESLVKLTVNDVTPPHIVGPARGALNSVRVAFSEPLDKATAEEAANYKVSGDARVTSATLADDGRSVLLELSDALPATGKPTVTVSGVCDASPNKNKLVGGTSPIELRSAVYHLASFVADGSTGLDASPKNFSVKASDPWTINLLVKPKGRIPERTIIAGFGNMDDKEGQGRYFSRFEPGLNFWVSDQDVATKMPVKADAWSMLTATYDGSRVRVFVDGALVGERIGEVHDDESIVRVAPLDPWEKERRFTGEVRDLTIWQDALPPAAVGMLWKTEAGKAR